MQKFKNILLHSILLLVFFIIGFIFYNFIDFDLMAEDLVFSHFWQCQDEDCSYMISELSHMLEMFGIISHVLLFCVSFFWILLKEVINNVKLTKYILVIIPSILNAILCYDYFIDYKSSGILEYDGLPMILFSTYYLIYNLVLLFIVTLIFKKKIK